MKKFYSLLVAAAMVMGATSCQKDAAETVATNEPVSFTATLNNTRTELGEGNKVMWNADDKITIYTQDNTAGVVFDGDATEAAATATFTTTSEFVASQTGYLAVYPELKYDLSTWPATGTVPAATYADGVYSVPVNIGIEQDAVANGWDEKYNYMVAYSQNNQLAFQAATALIKFTYTGYDGMPLDFYAEGANLAGEATLNYNTADGSISYTTTGTSTNITLYNLVQGETYYIPIYPGKVDYFHLRGMGITGNYETFYSYEGEFEFKAGKIYTVKAKVQGTPSPWTMMDRNKDTNVSMTIDDNGYHVAKAVPEGNFLFYAWDETNGEQNLTASKELGLYEWQATAEATSLESAFNIPMGNMFDVYLAPDASMFCLVETGATVPEMPVVSSWKLYLGDLSNTTMMFVENGFHVAKNINVSELGYFFFDEMNPLTATADVVLSKWQITKNAFDENYEPIPFFINSETAVDIYLSEDASMMCVVPAGEPMPTPFISEQTLWAISGELNNWGDTFLWTTETEGLLVAQNVTFETDYSEFKFRYDSNWDQQYTSEVYGIEANKWVVAANTTSLGNTSVLTAGTYDVYLDTTNSKIYVVTAGAAIEEAVEQTVSNQKPVESAGKLYLIPNANWKVDNARFAAYFFGNGELWLDMTDADSDGVYECELPEGYPSVIFCRMNPTATANNWSNKWNQTADLTVPTDGTNCYTVKEGTWDNGGGTWSTK